MGVPAFLAAAALLIVLPTSAAVSFRGPIPYISHLPALPERTLRECKASMEASLPASERLRTLPCIAECSTVLGGRRFPVSLSRSRLISASSFAGSKAAPDP